MSFGIFLYYHNKREELEGKELKLVSFFKGVITKLLLYEHHFKTTIELYDEEYIRRKTKIEVDIKSALNEADKKYEKLTLNSEDEDFDHQYAYNESGYEDIQYYYEKELEDLEYYFNEMNDYFKKSSLVLLYAAIESELRHLCNLLKLEFSKRISLDNLNDKNYLDSLFLYLDIVLELHIEDLRGEYSDRFKNLQYVRNRIMHNGGLFLKNEKNKDLNDVIKKSNGYLELDKEKFPDYDILMIKNLDYVNDYYEFTRSFFSDLLWVIEQKDQKYSIFSSRLRYLFGFLDPHLSVIINKVIIRKKTKSVVSQLTFTNEDLQVNIGCNIKIEKSTENKFEIIDQTDKIIILPKLNSLLEYFKTSERELNYSLSLFLEFETSKVTLTIYPGIN